MVSSTVPILQFQNFLTLPSIFLFARLSRYFEENKNLAGKPGFEPRLPGPEPGVLPLNYFPTANRLIAQKR